MLGAGGVSVPVGGGGGVGVVGAGADDEQPAMKAHATRVRSMHEPYRGYLPSTASAVNAECAAMTATLALA